MHIFSSRYEPLDAPLPLTGVRPQTIDTPDMQQVRTIQHDADNLLTIIRNRREREEREARQRIIDKQSNPRGIGRDE